MWTGLWLGASLILFLAGLRLSAFFSGSETGFYRVSLLKVGLDARSGDRTARHLSWYLRHPSSFVATTLVGNNVANYLTTAAIGLIAATLVPEQAGTGEVVATLAVSPLVFIVGELVPKTLYYRSPMQLLRRGTRWFNLFFWVFLPLGYPLMLITRLVERIGGSRERQLELILGRKRLVQVLSEGHREGLITPVQNRLAEGLLDIAAVPIGQSMTPVGRILGVTDDATRDQVLAIARDYGLPLVAVRRSPDKPDWFGYYRVVDVAFHDQTLKSVLRTLPRVELSSGKLSVLMTMRDADASMAAVYDDDTLVGLVSERGLIEQLFQPPNPPAVEPLDAGTSRTATKKRVRT